MSFTLLLDLSEV